MRVFLKSLRSGRSGSKALSMGLACALSFCVATVQAEEQKKPKPKHRNTPLDTIMQTHLHPDVPEPKDFVKEHRPAPETLNYQPVTGTDPERPKLRTPGELKDLEAELEAARVKADKKAGIKPTPAVVSKPKPAPAQ